MKILLLQHVYMHEILKNLTLSKQFLQINKSNKCKFTPVYNTAFKRHVCKWCSHELCLVIRQCNVIIANPDYDYNYNYVGFIFVISYCICMLMNIYFLINAFLNVQWKIIWPIKMSYAHIIINKYAMPWNVHCNDEPECYIIFEIWRSKTWENIKCVQSLLFRSILQQNNLWDQTYTSGAANQRIIPAEAYFTCFTFNYHDVIPIHQVKL